MEKQTKNGLIWFTILALLFSGFVVAKTSIGPKGVDTETQWVNTTYVNTDYLYINDTQFEEDILSYPQTTNFYTLWVSGSTYYAKNGNTGAVLTTTSFEQAFMYGNGGKIFIKAGTYTVDSGLSGINSGTYLQGEGPEKTIIQLGINTNLFQATNVTDITIRDISFSGQQSTYGADRWVGILFQNVTRFLIDNVRAYDFYGKGAFIRGSMNGAVVNSIFYDNGQDGLYLESMSEPSSKISVENCVSYNNTRKGFNNGDIRDISFLSCSSYDNGEDGWNIEGSTDGTYKVINVKLTNCKAYNNTIMGYKIQMWTEGISLINCDGFENGDYGADIRGHDTYLKKNTQIIGGSYYQNGKDGIMIRYGQQFTKVVGVSVYNNDQGETNADGIAGTFLTNVTYVIIDDVFAYDDQAVPTQNRGVDWSTLDLVGKQITNTNIDGYGNVDALIRATNDLRHFAPPS